MKRLKVVNILRFIRMQLLEEVKLLAIPKNMLKILLN
jgi:hypothetical protein